jgi:hypothetical protein
MSSGKLPPTQDGRRAQALLVTAVIVGASIFALSAGVAATSRQVSAGTRPGHQQGASPGEASPGEASPGEASPANLIPLTPLSGLTSLNASVTLSVNGTMNGKQTQGDLTAQLTSNDQAMSQIDVTGSLLGDIVAQVGGTAVKLFRPSKVSVYAVPEGTYVVLSSLFDACVKPTDSTATEALSQLSPQSLMNILTSDGVARGTFVADEVLDGMPVKHYRMDGAAFLAAAQATGDPTVSGFAKSLRSASDGDLYLAADGGYPVAYRGSFSGAFDPLAFDGDLTVAIDLTGVNTNTPVTLPSACDNPISQ